MSTAAPCTSIKISPHMRVDTRGRMHTHARARTRACTHTVKQTNIARRRHKRRPTNLVVLQAAFSAGDRRQYPGSLPPLTAPGRSKEPNQTDTDPSPTSSRGIETRAGAVLGGGHQPLARGTGRPSPAYHARCPVPAGVARPPYVPTLPTSLRSLRPVLRLDGLPAVPGVGDGAILGDGGASQALPVGGAARFECRTAMTDGKQKRQNTHTHGHAGLCVAQ